tara:strand:+ start:1844 stop:2167 length:324 start_codon:yes stop_codon:yes gene_type:complete
MAKRKKKTHQHGGTRTGSGRRAELLDGVEKKYRLPQATVDKIKALAKRESVSQNVIARQLLEIGMARFKSSDLTKPDTRQVTCPCGHTWATKTDKPRCYKCKKYLSE